MHDAGVDVVVATIAFGMGVDKANVRWVFHHDVSASVDAYYQELGPRGPRRCARPSGPVLPAEDLGLRRFFAGGPSTAPRSSRCSTRSRRRARPVDAAALLTELDLSKTEAGDRACTGSRRRAAVDVQDDGGCARGDEAGLDDAVEARGARRRRRGTRSTARGWT